MAEQYVLFCVRLRFSTTHMVALKRIRTQTNANRKQIDVNGSNRKQTEVKKIERKWKKANGSNGPRVDPCGIPHSKVFRNCSIYNCIQFSICKKTI